LLASSCSAWSVGQLTRAREDDGDGRCDESGGDRVGDRLRLGDIEVPSRTSSSSTSSVTMC
jgi:hypothetical protein